jgi:hypothetical protein
MNWLWVYWPAALTFIAIVLFGVPEYLALKHGGPTFSRFMAKMANAGPIGKIWVMAWGLLIGGLTVHFLGWCVACQGG